MPDRKLGKFLPFAWLAAIAFAASALGPCSSSPAQSTCNADQELARDGVTCITVVAAAIGATGGPNGNAEISAVFGPTGRVQTSLPSVFTGGQADRFNSIAIYPFAPSGTVNIDGSFTPLAGGIAGTGVMVVAGQSVTTSSNTVSLIARYDTAGALDTTFNQTGFVRGQESGFARGTTTVINAVAIDSYGRVVVVGHGNTTDIGGPQRTFVARYLPDGTLDQQFGPSPVLAAVFAEILPLPSPYGYMTVDPTTTGYILGPSGGWQQLAGGTPYDDFKAVAIDQDDNIIAVGFSGQAGTAADNYTTALVVRYTANGVLDGTFATTNPFPATEQIGSNGGYITGLPPLTANFGGLTSAFSSAAFNDSGRAGATNSDGLNDEALNAVALDASGDIIAAGYTTTALLNQRGLLIGVTPDGSAALFTPKTTQPFGICVDCPAFPGGTQVSRDSYNSVIIDQSGKIVVAGQGGSVATNGGAPWTWKYYTRAATARYSALGVLDASYGSAGYTIATAPTYATIAGTAYVGGTSMNEFFTGIVESGGGYVAVGSSPFSISPFEVSFAVAQGFTTTGAVDTTFGLPQINSSSLTGSALSANGSLFEFEQETYTGVGFLYDPISLTYNIYASGMSKDPYTSADTYCSAIITHFYENPFGVNTDWFIQ